MIRATGRAKNNIPSLGKAIRDALPERRRRAATDLRDAAKSRAPVRTGALRDSIEVIPQGDKTDLVEVGKEYGGFVNNGTRNMAAQPFWDEATLEMEAKYPGYFRRLI